MRIASLIALALLPGIAHADGLCPAEDDFTTTGLQLPVGCPLVVYGTAHSGSGGSIVMTLTRDGTTTTVMPPYREDIVTFDVHTSTFDIETCAYESSIVSTEYEHYAIDTTGFEAGDTINVLASSGLSVDLEPAGPCAPETTPQLECSSGISGACDVSGTDDHGGCATSSPSLLVGALALLLARKSKTATRLDRRFTT